MKKFFSLFVVALFAMSAMATQYCGETIVGANHNHEANITCESLGSNLYRFVFESADDIVSYNAAGSNFYAEVNGVGGYQVSNHLTQDGNTLSVTIESTVTPNIYVGAFFVVYSDGEELFNIPTDEDFSASCFTPVLTDYNIVGEYNGWSENGTGSDVKFYTTATEGTLVASAAEFTTGQWGFKVRKGTGWSNLYGSSNAISTGVVNALNGDYNIHVGQTQNNVTLHNVTFTITIDDEGNVTTLKVDADENVNVGDFHDRYMMVGTFNNWKFEDEFNPVKFTYVSENTYTASVDRIFGDWKIVKNSSWDDALGGGGTNLGVGVYNLSKGGDNTAFASGHIIRNATLTLVIANDGNATLTVEGTDTEEHSYGLVGDFQSWTTTTASLFEEQADGSWTLDLTDFPGNSAFKVSIDKTWTCFLADGAITTLTSGTPYTCVKANNNNNFKIGEAGKTYNAHFVLNVANDGNSAELTVTIHEGIYLENGSHAVELLPVHYTGTNNYCMTIISDEEMVGLGGSFWNVSGVGADMRTSMTRVDAHTLRFDVTSTSAPNIYTPLYVLMPGEVNFGSVNLVWKEAAAPTYVRTVTNGNYGSICLEQAATLEGATAYAIVGKTETAIVLNEVAALAAGVPYIFQATADELVATLSGAPVAEAGSANGLIGSFEGTNVAEGMYVLTNNTVKACGTGCTIAANRAYINLAAVPAATPAPEHRVIAIADVATALENANAENVVKMMEDGQLIIIKNGVRYNALGQVVK